MSGLEIVRVLLIDTCGETPGVAVCNGPELLAEKDLSGGSASAEILAVIRELLELVGWRLRELHAVGVVTGPGSFTGMRTGLAAAKGLCEAAGVRLAGVSRLEVLADAAGVSEGLVALDAGRGQVYVREVVSGREWVCGDADLDRRGTTERLPSEDEHRKNAGLVVADEKVALRLALDGAVLRRLHVRDALGVVLRRLGEHEPMRDGVVDANYVRAEQDIYAKVGERKPAVPFAMTGE